MYAMVARRHMHLYGTTREHLAAIAIARIAHPQAGAELTREALLAFYEGKIAKWWTPDDVVFVDAIPLGATGKMQKNKLREQFKDHKLPTA